MNTWKILQRKTYDILSHKYFLIIVFPSCLISVLLLSIIEIGEVWMLWSEKSLNGKPKNVITGRGCDVTSGIDAVYTWVNGSDPLLLHNLKAYHDNEEDNLNELWTDCPYANCEPSHMIFYRSCEPLPLNFRKQLSLPHVIKNYNSSINESHSCSCLNVTSIMISFMSVSDARQALQIKNTSGTLLHGYWTTDLAVAGSYPCPEWIYLSGFTSKFPSLTTEMIRKRLAKQFDISVVEVWPYPELGSIILKMPSAQAVNDFLARSRNLIISSDLVSPYRLSLVLHNPKNKRQDRFAPSRFEDKEELRYSLRSLEQHASWIRHIYLVTNGQIPYWLNLDHPQITLVTHDEIFPNRSHLPTFSSPAIESHLHRIKGLSDQFLYLNDDIMLAQDVWPEDFYTNSRGYKVYLSWPVPDCSPSCLWSWVSDGSCDAECNVEECGFDGGDCNETDTGPSHLHAHVIREDFSIYDDVASNQFPPDFDSVALGKKIIDPDTEYLQPPDLIQSSLRHPLLTNDHTEVEERAEGVGVRQGDPELLHYDLLDSMDRKKRAAVKKNLGSHEYVGSSMLAGQSADFLGSVTDSKTAINEALQVANKLREVQILNPVNSNKVPQENNSLLENNDLVQVKRIRNHYVYSSDHKSNYHEGAPEESNFLNMNFKTGPKPRHDSVNIQHSNRINFLHQVSTFQSVRDPIEGKNNSLQWNSSLPNSAERLLKRQRNWRNSTAGRQLLRNLMVNDLNESAGPVAKKGYKAHRRQKMRKLDSFAESLLHVNMLYNQEYGFEARRVPAHAPHFIDREIMSELQEKFSEEWESTSSHKLRDPHDMQFAFSYFYFLMSEEEDIHMAELFNKFDTDHSGTWSDREIRTLLTRVYPAPLNPHHLIQFEEYVLTCSRNMASTEHPPTAISTPMYERYQDSPLPMVTWELVRDCAELRKLLLSHLGRKMKFKFELVREWSRDVTFKMLSSNVSHLVGHLDDIRRNPKKFVCLNDNLDPKFESENVMVRALLRDFYHSFFPTPSKFELPLDMRNRFLHVSELNEWKSSRSKLRNAVILAVITLCLLTFAVICPDEFRNYGRRVVELSCVRRRRPSRIRCRSVSSSNLSKPLV